MKKALSALIVIGVVYVLVYIPVSLGMGAYGEIDVEGLGVESRWALYTNRDNLLTRDRQKALEVIFFPLLMVDRAVVHRAKRIGIETD